MIRNEIPRQLRATVVKALRTNILALKDICFADTGECIADIDTIPYGMALKMMGLACGDIITFTATALVSWDIYIQNRQVIQTNLIMTDEVAPNTVKDAITHREQIESDKNLFPSMLFNIRKPALVSPKQLSPEPVTDLVGRTVRAFIKDTDITANMILGQLIGLAEQDLSAHIHRALKKQNLWHVIIYKTKAENDPATKTLIAQLLILVLDKHKQLRNYVISAIELLAHHRLLTTKVFLHLYFDIYTRCFAKKPSNHDTHSPFEYATRVAKLIGDLVPVDTVPFGEIIKVLEKQFDEGTYINSKALEMNLDMQTKLFPLSAHNVKNPHIQLLLDALKSTTFLAFYTPTGGHLPLLDTDLNTPDTARVYGYLCQNAKEFGARLMKQYGATFECPRPFVMYDIARGMIISSMNNSDLDEHLEHVGVKEPYDEIKRQLVNYWSNPYALEYTGALMRVSDKAKVMVSLDEPYGLPKDLDIAHCLHVTDKAHKIALEPIIVGLCNSVA